MIQELTEEQIAEVVHAIYGVGNEGGQTVEERRLKKQTLEFKEDIEKLGFQATSLGRWSYDKHSILLKMLKGNKKCFDIIIVEAKE